MGKLRTFGLLLLAANQPFAQGASFTNSSAPATVTSLSSTPAATAPPCCFYQPHFVGINTWWNSSLVATVATVITSVIQYNNTVITTSTTIQNANATRTGTVPTGLIGNGIYTSSMTENATKITIGWDNQVIVSPTPFVTVAQVLYMRGEIATDKTATATCTPVYPGGDPAQYWDIIAPYVYFPNSDVSSSLWYVGGYVDAPTGLIDAWISQTPTITEKYPGLTTCQPVEGSGEPSIHIPVLDLTDHSTTTVSMDGGGGGEQPGPTSTPAPTSEPAPSTTPEPVVTPDPTTSQPGPTSEPQPTSEPTETPPQSTGGNSNTNPPQSSGGNGTPPQSSGGNSNQPQPTGGNPDPPQSTGGIPNPPQSSGGNSNPPQSTGGNTNPPQSSGGSENPAQSSGGVPNPPQSSGGDSNQPQPTGSDSNGPQSTGGTPNPPQSSGGDSNQPQPTESDSNGPQSTGGPPNPPQSSGGSPNTPQSSGGNTNSPQSSGGDSNQPLASSSAGINSPPAPQPSGGNEPSVVVVPAPSGSGVVIPGDTTLTPGQTVTVSGIEIVVPTAQPTEVTLPGGEVLTPGVTTTISGSQVVVPTNVVVVDGTTVPVQQTTPVVTQAPVSSITIGSETIAIIPVTESGSSGFVLPNSDTLLPGSTTTIGGETIVLSTGPSGTNIQVIESSTTETIPLYTPATSTSASTGGPGEYTGAASPNKPQDWTWLAAAGVFALL